MLRSLRPLGLALAPGRMADRDRRYQRRLRQRLGYTQAAMEWASEHGSAVSAGPLSGLSYPLEMLADTDAPSAKLKGVYEQPLQPTISGMIEHLRENPGLTFVNVGSADGYYAVGVALTVQCAVWAFDLSSSAQKDTLHLASANGVKVEIRGAATESSLLTIAPSCGAMLVDIDGAETQTITSRLAAVLKHAYMIVELHGSEAGRELPGRFRYTHKCAILEPDTSATEEQRTERTPWLVATPLTPPAASTQP